MKRNIKFFTLVISLLLVSMLVLAGCMYAIAANNGERKPYNLNGQKINFASSGGNIVEGDAPLAQASMQAKFEAMYDISGDGKSITVISKDYLDGFWLSNYEKEVIHSLTVEEVYYIIQDSIRIYYEYETVILPGFGSASSVKEVADRFPFVEAQEIRMAKTSSLDRDKVISDIHAIIMYRLTALSSTKAFFTGAEAIIYSGGDPVTYNGMYPGTIFYIPDYSEKTDRDYILSIMGGTTNFTDLERFSDLFVVSSFGEPVMEFSSISNGSTIKVFPTDEMFNHAIATPDGSGTNPDNTQNKDYLARYPYRAKRIWDCYYPDGAERTLSVTVPELHNAFIEHREDYEIYVDGEYLLGGVMSSCESFYLADVTGDGIPELCFGMNVGSGIIDSRIEIFDYATRKSIFSLSDRMDHDYRLFVRNGNLCVMETEWMYQEGVRTGMLIYDGSRISVFWDSEANARK